MNEQELLYGHSSIAIAITLFVVIIVFNEIGFQAGRIIQSRTDDEIKSLTGSIQASILGLLALLLSFTFSMSMQRYDNRSMALIDEANTIGTAILRVQLLPEHYQKEAHDMLREYVELRITIGKIDLTKRDERNKFNQQISDLQNRLWSLAVHGHK